MATLYIYSCIGLPNGSGPVVSSSRYAGTEGVAAPLPSTRGDGGGEEVPSINENK